MIDAHAHIDFSVFDEDRTQVLRRARDVGIETIVIPGVAPAQWDRSTKLGFPCCVGFHPQWLEHDPEIPQTRSQLTSYILEHAERLNAVGIGEFGLDRRSSASEHTQKIFFHAHLNAAKESGLPIVLHVVGRHGAALEMLSSFAPLRGMVHGFSASVEVAKAYLRLGLNLCFGGLITRTTAKKARSVARSVPLDHLLIETDSPDMLPVGAPTIRNEPSYLPYVLRALTELRSETEREIATRTCENAKELFL